LESNIFEKKHLTRCPYAVGALVVNKMPVLPTPYLLFTKARTDYLLTDPKAYTKAKAQCKKEFASLTDEDLLYWIDEAEYEEDFYLVIILITRSLNFD